MYFTFACYFHRIVMSLAFGVINNDD